MEWIGLAVSVVGALIMSIGDEYILPMICGVKDEEIEEDYEDYEELDGI